MTEKKANQMLEVLQRGDPKEMDSFIRGAQALGKLRGVRGTRRAVAAGVGAAAGAAYKYMTGDDDEE